MSSPALRISARCRMTSPAWVPMCARSSPTARTSTQERRAAAGGLRRRAGGGHCGGGLADRGHAERCRVVDQHTRRRCEGLRERRLLHLLSPPACCGLTVREPAAPVPDSREQPAPEPGRAAPRAGKGAGVHACPVARLPLGPGEVLPYPAGAITATVAPPWPGPRRRRAGPETG